MTIAIRQLEHISLRAWQALEVHPYDGWHLRFANGYTGRANSVQVLDGSSLALAEKIAYCEAWYAERSLPCIFRLTNAMQPPSLDLELERRGYERYNETLVQTSDLSQQTFPIDNRFHYQAHVTDEWLRAWGLWNNVPLPHIATAKQMLSQQTLRRCYAWIDDLAVGLAVVEEDYVGLFDIVVKASARGQGLGKVLVRSLLGWAQEHAAQTAYLQVTKINAPALSVYAKLGFKTHHHYWYRRR